MSSGLLLFPFTTIVRHRPHHDHEARGEREQSRTPQEAPSIRYKYPASGISTTSLKETNPPRPHRKKWKEGESSERMQHDHQLKNSAQADEPKHQQQDTDTESNLMPPPPPVASLVPPPQPKSPRTMTKEQRERKLRSNRLSALRKRIEQTQRTEALTAQHCELSRVNRALKAEWLQLKQLTSTLREIVAQQRRQQQVASVNNTRSASADGGAASALQRQQLVQALLSNGFSSHASALAPPHHSSTTSSADTEALLKHLLELNSMEATRAQIRDHLSSHPHEKETSRNHQAFAQARQPQLHHQEQQQMKRAWNDPSECDSSAQILALLQQHGQSAPTAQQQQVPLQPAPQANIPTSITELAAQLTVLEHLSHHHHQQQQQQQQQGPFQQSIFHQQQQQQAQLVPQVEPNQQLLQLLLSLSKNDHSAPPQLPPSHHPHHHHHVASSSTSASNLRNSNSNSNANNLLQQLLAHASEAHQPTHHHTV